MTCRSIVIVLLLATGAIPAAPAQDQPAPQRRFRESMALDTSTVVVKRMATVGEYLADGQIDEAVEILRDISTASGDTLVPVEPGRYVNARLYGHLLVAGLPPQGLAAYRQRVDAQARQWFEQGRDRRDEALVRRVVEQSFASSFGDDALWLLGEWAWDRGELSAARAYWTQMLAIEQPAEPGQPLPVLRYPDSDRPPAEILARLALVSIMTGDLERAADEIAVFRTRHPHAAGDLAGRRGNFVEILEAVLDEARDWTMPPGVESFQTFAANPQRNATLATPGLDVGHVLWSDALPPERWATDNPRPALRPDPPLRLFPVVHGDMVLASDGQQIYHWKLRANEPTPVWPAGEGGVALYPDVPDAVRAGYISPRVIGVPRHTLTVHNGRLYAKLGSPIAGRAEEIRTFPSYIVCLDLSPEKQGKSIWELSADELMPDQPGWMFEGTPVAQSDRVFVALRRNHPDATLRVACLDAGSGRPIWNRQVGSAVFGLGEKSNLMSHQLLTLGENAVFYSTDMGAVMALDRRDGQPLWVVTYESRWPDDVEPLNDHLRNGLTPCLYHRGLVIAAPNDHGGVLAIDAETGLVRWEQRRLPDRIRHLLGVGHGKVFVSGNALWGLDLRTGSFRPPEGWGDRAEQNPQVWGYGQGLLLGDVILFPKRDSIDVREQSTGRRSRLIRLREHDPSATGGNLAVAGKHLIVAEPNRIVVFSDTSGLLEEQRRIVEANPDSIRARLELGRTLVLAGQFEDGLEQFQRAAAVPPADDAAAALRNESRQHLFDLLLRLGTRAADTGDLPQAVSRLTTAIEQAPDDRSRLAAVWRLAGIQEKHARAEHAVRTYQSVLRDGTLGRLEAPVSDHRTAASAASAAIGRLIETYGSHVYAAFEEEAARRFSAALAAGEPPSIRQALDVFPNARAAAATRLELARLLRRREELRDASRTCRELLASSAVEAQVRRGALELLARTHEDRGYWRLAARTWQQWADEFPRAAVPDELMTAAGARGTTATEFIARRLSAADYERGLADSGDNPPLPWERRWTRTLPGDGSLLIPEGAAPAADLECILVSDTGLKAIDRNGGGDRWNVRSDHPALWAAGVGEALVVGTRHAVRGLSFERGEVLWHRSLNGSSAVDPAISADPRFAAIGDSVVCLLPGSRLIAIDADGQLSWEYSTPGRIGRRWLCDEQQIVVQSFAPDRTLIVDSRTGRLLAEFPGDAAPWLRDPLRISPHRFVFIDGARRIRSVRASDPSGSWAYSGPASHANAEPDVMVAGQRLLVVMDGDTLVSINAESGLREWSRALSRQTAVTNCSALTSDADSVYAACAGILRRIALSDGTVLWERFVGAADRHWQAQRFGRYVAAWPGGGPVARRPGDAVILCEATSGMPVQEVAFPRTSDSASTDRRLDPDSRVTLLVSDGVLAGLDRMEVSPSR